MLAPTNILVAADFSECSMTALTYGRSLARLFGARLHILHVIEPFAMDSSAFGMFAAPAVAIGAQLEAAARQRLAEIVTDDDRRELRAVVALRSEDTPAHAIVQYCREERIDLVLVGTHGRKGFSHAVMGSVAEKVVRLAPCPVLTVHEHARNFITSDLPVAQSTAEQGRH